MNVADVHIAPHASDVAFENIMRACQDVILGRSLFDLHVAKESVQKCRLDLMFEGAVGVGRPLMHNAMTESCDSSRRHR